MLSHRSLPIVVCIALISCGGGNSPQSPVPQPVGSPAVSASPTPGATLRPSPSPTPTAAGSASEQTSIDCSYSTNYCATIPVAGESPAPGGFHGYADPEMRHDPSSGVEELAYSWAHTLSDGSHVVDLHLAHSSNGGTTWTYDGALFASQPVANSASSAYAASNNSSTETISLYPLPQSGSTLWIQAHWDYLVASGSTDIYGQAYATNYVSVSATSVPAGSPPNALLSLGTAPEARLGNAATDPSFHADSNLSTYAPAVKNCGQFQQPALYALGGTVYLGLQCFEQHASGDGSATAFFVFDTVPTGNDASAWTWAYVGEFATPAQAAALGKREGTTYQLFTELQFVALANGSLAAVLSPAAVTTTGQQPAIQYGCRVIPMTSPAAPALQTDGTGAPIVLAKVTDDDLYTAPNEGPGSCTYDASSKSGVVIARKYEDDPSLGFFQSLQGSGLRP